MTVAGNSAVLGHMLILDGGLEHHAFGKLLDQVALDFLPGRLARRVRRAAGLCERVTAPRELRVRDQYVGGTLVEVDAHTVASPQQRQPAADGRFRRRIEDRRRTRRAGLAA